MGMLADSMVAYAQPLLDKTDGSPEQMQKALSIAQICWTIALLPEEEQKEIIPTIGPTLKMNDEDSSQLCESVVMPMVKRHREMFPNMHRPGTEKTASRTYKKNNDVGRNDPCPCNSGKKYKKCCGR